MLGLLKPSAVLGKSTGSGTRVVWDTSDSIPTASSPTEGQHEIQTVLPSVELPTPDFTIPPAQDGTTVFLCCMCTIIYYVFVLKCFTKPALHDA